MSYVETIDTDNTIAMVFNGTGECGMVIKTKVRAEENDSVCGTATIGARALVIEGSELGVQIGA